MKDNKLCPLPWIHSAIRNNGHYRVCCHSNTSASKGALNDDKGVFLSASDTPTKETRNHSALKQIRSQMLQGQWPEACKRCHMEEDSGLRSRRVYEWKKWNHVISPEKMMAKTDMDGQIEVQDFPITSLDLRFGNLCNLKCRMCGPTDSSSWYREYQNLYGVDHFFDTHGKVFFKDSSKNSLQKAYSWFENENYWQDLLEQAENLEYIYFVGGEPLLIKPHLDFLQRLADEGLAKNIDIEYNTNLTHLNLDILNLWKHFRKVSLGVSLDAFGKVNDYIRYPSDFTKLEENIRRVDNFGLENLEMWIAPTIQIYNIFELDQLLTWIVQSDFHFVKKRAGAPLFTSHILHRPNYLNIQILDKKAKSLAGKHLDHCQDLLNKWETQGLSRGSIEKTRKIIEGIRTYMNKEDQSQYLEKFKGFSQNLDKMRSEDLAKSIPRLFNVIQESSLTT